MDPTELRGNMPVAGEPGSPEERHLCRLSSGMTLEEFYQWQEVLMINPTMAMNPSLTASGQQRIPLVPPPLEPPIVNRDLLPSTVAPTDPRQFCVPSKFESSVLPNAAIPNMMPNHVYSGWGILPPESLKAMARRNEMIQRQHTARMEMEMRAIYQQRKIEKANPKGLAGLGIPSPYGSSVAAGPATCYRRTVIPARDLHLHRCSLRKLHGNPMLMAASPRYLEGWGQKCRHLRRGTGNQKLLDSDTESSKSQAEEKSLGQIHVIPHEEDECAKDPEIKVCNNQNSREINEEPPAVLSHPGNTYTELERIHRKPWGPPDIQMEARAGGGGQGKVPEQFFAACSGKNGIYPPVPRPSLPGTHVLVTSGENSSLDEDIQKWTVSDVCDFVRGLPGCSDYAQIFKDHAIDGETLPLLTEKHLRSTMGLKLGPALKVQLQVSQHVESMLYKRSFSLPTHTKQAFDQAADTSPPLDFNSWGDTLGSTCSQDIIIPKGVERDSTSN